MVVASSLWPLTSTRKLSYPHYGISVIRKVRKTQHHNPEFGHTQGEIFFLTAKKVHDHSRGDETQKTINFGGKLSFILSFLFPERLHCCYICFHCSYTTTIISLEPCVLSISYWDLLKCLYFAEPTERGDRGWKEAQRYGYFSDNSIVYYDNYLCCCTLISCCHGFAIVTPAIICIWSSAGLPWNMAFSNMTVEVVI
jgi:hypothetical protein